MPRTIYDLEDTLHRIDGRGYPAYRDLTGSWGLGGPAALHVDKVQADPFAPASRMRVGLPLAEAALPDDLLSDPAGRVATADFIQRTIAEALSHSPGNISVGTPTQEIVERSGVTITATSVEARLTVPLPAERRKVLGRRAARLLLDVLPEVVVEHLAWEGLDHEALRRHVRSYRDQLEAQAQLSAHGLVGFVADDAVLPRASGDSELPLADAVTFLSPESLATTLTLSSGTTLTGMGIPAGITVIVGGGFHGKSTLLRALAKGVHPHLPGDGREFVLSAADTVAVRAEDGRAVTGVDITPFINGLPSGSDTGRFSTLNASGSTSQAAGIVEALEVGATTLLLDEDTCATNFMLRDDTMRKLIPDEQEPITPFVQRIRSLAEAGVSTVLVAGGSSAFLPHADTVVRMQDYEPQDVTQRAHDVAGPPEPTPPGTWYRSSGGLLASSGTSQRVLAPGEPSTGRPQRGKRPRPPAARGRGLVRMGEATLDLTAVSQVLDHEQTEGIARALARIAELSDGRLSLADAVGQLHARIRDQGLAALLDDNRHPGHVALPRAAEIAAAVNRCRGLRMSR